MFSIAYDDCWNVYVDGKKASKQSIAGAFLGVRLKRGKHDIKISAVSIN